MTKHTIEYDECRSLESTVEQLESVLDGLRARALTIAHGDRRLLFLLAPGAPLEMSIHAERSGNRERLEISLEWRRQNLHIQAGSALGQAACEPLTEERLDGAERAEGALQDRDEDPEEDEEDWDDQAETVRQGSHLLAQELQRNSLEH